MRTAVCLQQASWPTPSEGRWCSSCARHHFRCPPPKARPLSRKRGQQARQLVCAGFHRRGRLDLDGRPRLSFPPMLGGPVEGRAHRLRPFAGLCLHRAVMASRSLRLASRVGGGGQFASALEMCAADGVMLVAAMTMDREHGKGLCSTGVLCMLAPQGADERRHVPTPPPALRTGSP